MIFMPYFFPVLPNPPEPRSELFSKRLRGWLLQQSPLFLSLKINYRGAVLSIHNENNDSTFQWSGEKPLDLLLNDHPITVNSSKKLNPTL